MAAELQPEPRTAAQIDETVTAAIRAVAAARREDAATVATVLGVNQATYYRRLQQGGWRAAEVAILAAHFGVSVSDLYEGRISVGRAYVQVTRDYLAYGGNPSGLLPRQRSRDDRERLRLLEGGGQVTSSLQPPLCEIIPFQRAASG